MSKAKIKELKIQLNQLLDELDALNEEYERLPEDDPEADMILAEISQLEEVIGNIEEQLELLR